MRRFLLLTLLALQPLFAGAADVGKKVPGVVLPQAPLNAPAQIPQLPQLPAGPLAAGSVTALPAAQLPGVLPPIPALPPSLPAAAAAVPSGQAPVAAAADHASRRHVPGEAGAALPSEPQQARLANLTAMGEALRRAGLLSQEQLARLSGGQLFDGSGPGASRGPDGWQPKLPRGVLRAYVHEVHTTNDVDLLIPSGINSAELIEKLKTELKRMAPYRVVTYLDAKGGAFTGIDLSQNPKLIDDFPEQHSHEIQLVKKIQLWTRDLQLVVREDGKTPDLVMGGVLTELKSLIGPHVDFTFLVDKANKQVGEHAARHGLGRGAAVVDMPQEKGVPVPKVLADLEAWRRQEPNVVLDRVYVFAHTQLVVFERGKDGAYAVADPKTISFLGAGPRLEARPQDVRALQLLLKRGRVKDVQRKLSLIEEAPAGDLNHPISQLRRAAETEAFMGWLSKLLSDGDAGKAWTEWQLFKAASPEQARQLAPRVRDILPDMSPSQQADRGADLVSRELSEPGARMDAAGVTGTVSVSGSGRLRPGSPYYEEARRFGALAATNGGGRVAVVTNGGTGVAEAANRGAFEADGPSAVYDAKGEDAGTESPYVTPGLGYRFQYSFTREIALRRRSLGFVYFPGGYNTMDEILHILNLMQTGRMARAPIVLVGEKEHWTRLLDFEHLGRQGLVSPKDLSLFRFAETADDAWRIVSGEQKSRPKDKSKK